MIYRYRIEFIDRSDENKNKISVGFCEAIGYKYALEKLIGFFKEENIVSLNFLKLIGDHNIIELASGDECADSLKQAEHILDKYEETFIW